MAMLKIQYDIFSQILRSKSITLPVISFRIGLSEILL